MNQIGKSHAESAEHFEVEKTEAEWPHRSALPPLRRSPGTRVRRRPPSDRVALLHQRRLADLLSGVL